MDPSTKPQPYVPPAQQPIQQPPIPPTFAPQPVVPQAPPSYQNPAFPPIIPQQPYAPMSPPVTATSQSPVGNVKHDLVEQLQKANNILVTVNSNPSVDQLSAAIGLTLILNKLNKHATAVYSGETPSTIEFLSPEKTIEKNTDSLRDFIIALDKAKADKLRYKVEDKFVKIFITPYHTSLSEKDLEFSQGDFNVDVVVALGVHQREELDQAIIAHGRILHDAVTISVNNKQTAELGALNWFQADASSLCEMVVGLIEPLQGEKALLDSQIATAFLTGVVAETERFSNAKTTPHTMNISAILMKAGANQQLVASKLEVPKPIPQEKTFDSKKMDELAHEGKAAIPEVVPTPNKDGSLEIKHKDEKPNQPAKTLKDLEKENQSDSDNIEDDLAKIHIDEEGKLLSVDKLHPESSTSASVPPPTPPISSNMIMTPPAMGGSMNSPTEASDIVSEPVAETPSGDLAEHVKTINPLTEEEKGKTLEQIEEAVHSTHVDQVPAMPVAPVTQPPVNNVPVPAPMPMPMPPTPIPSEEVARNAVQQAADAAEPTRLEPEIALNAQPIDLGQSDQAPVAPEENSDNMTNEEVFPPQLIGPDAGPAPDPTAGAVEASAPPLVPPPLMPPPS